MSPLQTDPTATTLLDNLAERAARLYTLPKVAMEVLELTSSATVDSEALAQCIVRDPALTAKILRVVNSAMFGLSAQVTQLTQAVSLLGAKPLKLLVLGFSLPPKLLDRIDEQVLTTFWQHALVKAAASKELAQRDGMPDEEEAFIAGLLQDLGTLVLIQQLGTAYTKLFVSVRQDGSDLLLAERDAFGFTHIDLTQRVLQEWSFPSLLVSAVATPFRGHPVGTGQDTADRLVAQLYVAELLTRQLTSTTQNAEELARAANSALGMPTDMLMDIVDQLKDTAPQLAQAFGVPWTDDTYVATVSDAHRQLSALVESVILEANPSIQMDRDQKQLNSYRDLIDDVRIASRQSEWACGESSDYPSDQSAAPAHPPDDAPTAVADNVPSMTGDEGLQAILRRAAMQCRQQRISVGLLLLEIENFRALAQYLGQLDASTVEAALQAHVTEYLAPELPVYAPGDGHLAAVLAGRDRLDVVSDTRQLIRSFTAKLTEIVPTASVATIAGFAVVRIPPKNFHAPALVEAAERCLYAARCAGGEAVKSIEL